MSVIQSDVVIVGAGMVGTALASLLARCGFSVALIEARQPVNFDPESDYGTRVSALSPGSAAIIKQAGGWNEISNQRHCAYRKMLVEDRDSSTSIQFEAPVFGLEALGYIVENSLVQTALWNSIEANALVEVLCPETVSSFSQENDAVHVSLSGGQQLEARLLVGCDGGFSQIRQCLGMKEDIHEYNQRGLVCVVENEQPNPGVAWQRFLNTGPLAFLPLSDGRSSIVWTLPASKALELVECPDDEFSRQLDEVTGGWLGSVIRSGPRASFALSMRRSEQLVSGRALLIGDAAHVVHPLAGQGVNLGLADAAALVETLVANRKAGIELADRASLNHFGRWRKSESGLMAQGVHALGAMFAPDSLTIVRRLGMGVVGRSWSIREAFIRRAAGLNANAPRLSQGEELSALLRG